MNAGLLNCFTIEWYRMKLVIWFDICVRFFFFLEFLLTERKLRLITLAIAKASEKNPVERVNTQDAIIIAPDNIMYWMKTAMKNP